MKSYTYKCKYCGEEVQIEILKVLTIPHAFSSRLIKCPKCGRRHFMKKIK